MPGKKLRLLIADDEELILEGLSIILSAEPGFVVAGTARDGAQALARLNESPVDLILLDLQMPGMGGLEFIPLSKKGFPDVRILVLTTFHDDRNIADAIRLGADGYLLKDAGREALVRAVREVSLGQSVIDGRVMTALSRNLREADPPAEDTVPANLPELTARETEICRLIADGLTNSQIASVLYLSEGTIKNYVMAIYEKTDIRDRVKLALYYKNATRKT